MFADLQMKLTDQFRAESDAKEAEISALKVHVSVLQKKLLWMRCEGILTRHRPGEMPQPIREHLSHLDGMLSMLSTVKSESWW